MGPECLHGAGIHVQRERCGSALAELVGSHVRGPSGGGGGGAEGGGGSAPSRSKEGAAPPPKGVGRRRGRGRRTQGAGRRGRTGPPPLTVPPSMHDRDPPHECLLWRPVTDE